MDVPLEVQLDRDLGRRNELNIYSMHYMGFPIRMKMYRDSLSNLVIGFETFKPQKPFILQVLDSIDRILGEPKKPEYKKFDVNFNGEIDYFDTDYYSSRLSNMQYFGNMIETERNCVDAAVNTYIQEDMQRRQKGEFIEMVGYTANHLLPWFSETESDLVNNCKRNLEKYPYFMMGLQYGMGHLRDMRIMIEGSQSTKKTQSLKDFSDELKKIIILYHDLNRRTQNLMKEVQRQIKVYGQ